MYQQSRPQPKGCQQQQQEYQQKDQHRQQKYSGRKSNRNVCNRREVIKTRNNMQHEQGHQQGASISRKAINSLMILLQKFMGKNGKIFV
jgi:hypothetical protein